jgi:hypothetical protein
MSSIHNTNDTLTYIHLAVTFLTIQNISSSQLPWHSSVIIALVYYVFHFHEHSVKQRNSDSSVNVVTKLQDVSFMVQYWSYSADRPALRPTHTPIRGSCPGAKQQGTKLTMHLHFVLAFRRVEMPIRSHDVMLNWVNGQFYCVSKINIQPLHPSNILKWVFCYWEEL